MIDNIFEKIKGIMLKPVETFHKIKNESLESAVIYFLVLFVGFFILFLSFVAYQSRFLFNSAIFIKLSELMFQLLLMIIIGTLILHIFVYLFGGKKGFKQTIKASLYSYTPLLIIGWIPFLFLIGVIWAFVLEILAVRDFQEISTLKAFLSAIVSFVVYSGLSVAFTIVYETIL